MDFQGLFRVRGKEGTAGWSQKHTPNNDDRTSTLTPARGAARGALGHCD